MGVLPKRQLPVYMYGVAYPGTRTPNPSIQANSKQRKQLSIALHLEPLDYGCTSSLELGQIAQHQPFLGMVLVRERCREHPRAG